MTVLADSKALASTISMSADPRDRFEHRLIISSIAVFSLLSITMAICSKAFLEGDACSHYLAAQAAFANPAYLVSVWDRPFCTGIYMLPAHFFGRLGVRFTSLSLAISISVITREIAKGQGWRWPSLALLFLLAQPLVFLHSFSELTELPFALLISLGFLAYQRRQFFWMALIIGITPLSRPEGFGFSGLALLALLLHRRWWWAAVLVLPVLLWDLAGWKIYGCAGPWWRWLPDHWPWGKDSVYQPGPLLYFVSVMPAVASPFIFPATVAGAWLCLVGTKLSGLSRWISNALSDHRRRCEILIAVLPLLILIGHSLLYWRGKMASNGEVRYMLVVAPFWALLSARGWVWIFQQLDWKQPLLWAALAATLPVLVNRAWTVLPMGDGPDWVEAQHISDWYNTGTLQKQYPYLEISHPGLNYWLKIDPESGRIREWKKSVIDVCPPGTLLIWDRIGATFNSDSSRCIPLDEIRKAGWKPLKTRWTDGAGEWQFFESDPITNATGLSASAGNVIR